jgi:hypothetical protein
VEKERRHPSGGGGVALRVGCNDGEGAAAARLQWGGAALHGRGEERLDGMRVRTEEQGGTRATVRRRSVAARERKKK